MGAFQIDPDRLSQFGKPRFGKASAVFTLVTSAGQEAEFKLLPTESYRHTRIVPLAAGASLEDVLGTEEIPDDADVLVVCPDTFLASPRGELIGNRRISVLPCGSTPTTSEQIVHFLDALHRSDVDRQDAFCAGLAAALEETDTLRLQDAGHGTNAWFALDGDYEWNQQAGPIAPGEQQVAPPGEFSALLADINTFDPDRRMGLQGSLTVAGPPIVHRANRDGLLDEQARLFGALDTTRRAPLRVDIEAGLITDWRALDPAAEPAAEALYELFDLSDNYRIVWELGIGCNEAIEPCQGNCGMNEMYGTEAGVLHLGLGLTPATDFAITLSCRYTIGLNDKGRRVIGAPPRRLNRTRSAGCGCVG